MKERIRNEILNVLVDKIDNDLFTEFKTQLDLILYDYDVSLKCTDLAVLDTSNIVIIKNFLCVKKLEGRSDNTISLYKHILMNLINELQKNISDIGTNDIRYHLANYQVNRGVSTTTLNNMRNIYNSFFGWCYNEKYIEENPMVRINPFKIPKKKVNAFTDEELETLFNNCECIRDRALMEFLYSTGCRVTECSDVNLNDIDFNNNTVIIRHGKGNKERKSYISDKCMYWLKKYLEERNSNDIALWIGKKGRLTASGIEYIITKIGNKCGIHAHPHKFRHTLATNMVKKSAPIQVVQQVLGHEDISVSMVYIDLLDKDIENAHKKYV